MSSGKTRTQKTIAKHSGMNEDQTYEIERRRVANTRLLIQYVGTGFLILLSAVPIAVTIPIVRALAGQETILNVSIAVTITIALSATNTVTGVAWWRRDKEVKRLERRNKKLGRQLHIAQERLREAGLNPVLTSDKDR